MRSGASWRLWPMSDAPPARHRASPATVAPAIRLPCTSHARRITKMGAEQAKKVALATVVLRIDRCQKNKSPAKARPASTVAREKRRVCGGALASSSRIQAYSTGKARNTRQNALAKGPMSAAARRTNSGETPIAAAPAHNAAKAGPKPTSSRAGRELEAIAPLLPLHGALHDLLDVGAGEEEIVVHVEAAAVVGGVGDPHPQGLELAAIGRAGPHDAAGDAPRQLEGTVVRGRDHRDLARV